MLTKKEQEKLQAERDEAFADFTRLEGEALKLREEAEERKRDAERADSFARNAENVAKNARTRLLRKLGIEGDDKGTR
jgi:hypothetical protein